MFKDYLTALLAITILAACTAPSRHRRGQFTRVLDHAQEQNLAYDSITNVDSIRMAVDYFNRHGSANEQMRASYLLGCAYRDMGDAPRALENYQNAAERADTASRECDYALLCKIHCQMAAAFSSQYMPDYEITEQQKAVEYAVKAKDSLLTVQVMEHLANILYQKGEYDRALLESEQTANLYRAIGDVKSANSSLGPAVLVLLRNKDYEKARSYLQLMELNSNVYDTTVSHGSQASLLSACWGNLYLGEGKPDSAYHYFLRGIGLSLDNNSRMANVKGLYELFTFQNKTDSVAKYAILYSNTNDSIIAALSAQSMQRIKAQYNYSQFEKIAKQKEQESMSIRIRLTLLAALFLASFFVAYYLFSRYKRSKEREMRTVNLMYVNTWQQYRATQNELTLLREMNDKQSEKISVKEKEITQLQQKLSEYQSDKLRPELWDVEASLLCSPIVNHLHHLAAAGKQAGDAEWRDLRMVVNQYIPGFIKSLSAFPYQMNARETNLCILVKLRFLSSEISTLFNVVNSQTISNLRIRLHSRLFGEKGKANEFDEKIRNLNIL